MAKIVAFFSKICINKAVIMSYKFVTSWRSRLSPSIRSIEFEAYSKGCSRKHSDQSLFLKKTVWMTSSADLWRKSCSVLIEKKFADRGSMMIWIWWAILKATGNNNLTWQRSNLLWHKQYILDGRSISAWKGECVYEKFEDEQTYMSSKMTS